MKKIKKGLISLTKFGALVFGMAIFALAAPHLLFAQIKLASGQLKIASDDSEILNLSEGKLGFIPPKLSADEIKKLKNPGAGTLVYNITIHAPMLFDGLHWKTIAPHLPRQTFDDIKKMSSKDIIDLPKPGYAMVVFNTSEKRAGVYDVRSGQWLYEDTKKRMFYSIGEELDGGRVCYIKDGVMNDGVTTGAHGLIVKDEAIRAFYPYELIIIPNLESLVSPEGEKQTAELLKAENRESKKITVNFYKKQKRSAWQWIRHNLPGDDVDPGNETYGAESFTMSEFDQKIYGSLRVKSILEVLNQENRSQSRKWFIPTDDEIEKIKNAILNNRARFSLEQVLSNPTNLFFPSNRTNNGPQHIAIDFKKNDVDPRYAESKDPLRYTGLPFKDGIKYFNNGVPSELKTHGYVLLVKSF